MSNEFAGALRERVSIEQRTADRDVWAGAVGGYGYDGSAWAAVSPLAGDASSSADRWRVILRIRDGIGPATRFVWRGKYLKVRTVECDPAAPAQMRVTCEEQR